MAEHRIHDADEPDVPAGQYCLLCIFFDVGFCEYWQDFVLEDQWCPEFA